MPITYRKDKDGPLTYEELDENFQSLDSDITNFDNTHSDGPNRNTTVGEDAMVETEGGSNVVVGVQALSEAGTGSNARYGNVCIGTNAGSTISWNHSGETDYNVLIGDNVGTAHWKNPMGMDAYFWGGKNNIIIGPDATGSAQVVNNEITLGNEAHTKFRIPGIGLEADSAGITIAGQPIDNLEVSEFSPDNSIEDILMRWSTGEDTSHLLRHFNSLAYGRLRFLAGTTASNGQPTAFESVDGHIYNEYFLPEYFDDNGANVNDPVRYGFDGIAHVPLIDYWISCGLNNDGTSFGIQLSKDGSQGWKVVHQLDDVLPPESPWFNAKDRFDIAVGGNRIVILCQDFFLVSDQLIEGGGSLPENIQNWTRVPRSDTTKKGAACVSWVGDKFLAAGANEQYLTHNYVDQPNRKYRMWLLSSVDGLNWSEVITPDQEHDERPNEDRRDVPWIPTGIAHSPDGTVTIVGGHTFVDDEHDKNGIVSQDGGSTWERMQYFSSSNSGFADVAYGGGYFFGIGHGKTYQLTVLNEAYLSSDGVNWTEIEPPAMFLDRVVYGRGVFACLQLREGKGKSAAFDIRTKGLVDGKLIAFARDINEQEKSRQTFQAITRRKIEDDGGGNVEVLLDGLEVSNFSPVNSIEDIKMRWSSDGSSRRAPDDTQLRFRHFNSLAYGQSKFLAGIGDDGLNNTIWEPTVAESVDGHIYNEHLLPVVLDNSGATINDATRYGFNAITYLDIGEMLDFSQIDYDYVVAPEPRTRWISCGLNRDGTSFGIQVSRDGVRSWQLVHEIQTGEVQPPSSPWYDSTRAFDIAVGSNRIVILCEDFFLVSDELIAGSGGSIYENLTNWTKVYRPETTKTGAVCVSWVGDKFLAAGSNRDYRPHNYSNTSDPDRMWLLSSVDGLNWSEVITPDQESKDGTSNFNPDMGWRPSGIAHSPNGVVVIVGGHDGYPDEHFGNGIVSQDGGLTWERIKGETGSNAFADVAYGGGYFFGVGRGLKVGQDGPFYPYVVNKAVISADGVNWTEMWMPEVYMDRVAYGRGIFTCMSSDPGAVAKSFDPGSFDIRTKVLADGKPIALDEDINEQEKSRQRFQDNMRIRIELLTTAQ